MFIVWKRRPITSPRPEEASRRHDHHAACPHPAEGERWALVPSLVRSRRVGGCPRQEHVARLPSIRSCCVADPIARAAWWASIERELASWRSLVGTDCDAGWFDEDLAAAVVARLAETVPAPTEAERRAYRARRAERERELDARFEVMRASFARAMGWE
jgi:hypothetical protein